MMMLGKIVVLFIAFFLPSDATECSPENVADIVESRLSDKLTRIENTMKQMLNFPPSLLHSSCEEIKAQFPNSPSGYYTTIDATGHAHHVYCQMERICGSSSGWTRMAYLNMSDPTEECPSGFKLHSQNGVRACGRPVTSGGSCLSVRFSSHSISYSQVCGRVYGYQEGSVDGFYREGSTSINGNYVDGISITNGNPRRHLWTFVAGQQENAIALNGEKECPCSVGSTQHSYVGSDYFCESGSPTGFEFGKFYHHDRLWDGEQCGSIERPCCVAPGLPWFHKTLSTPTCDYIELRLCCDQDTADEDVAVGLYEIYVK